MAKKINVKGSYYRVNANVVMLDSEGNVSVEAIANVSCERSERANKKKLIEKAEKMCEGSKCINVVNVTIERVTYTDEYIIKADNATIINACVAYGLDVFTIDSEGNEIPVESEK